MAHGAFGSMGPFWGGALHVFVAPLSVVTITGLAAALAPIPRGESGLEIVAAVLAAALGAWLLTPWAQGAAAAAIAVGLTAALGVTPGRTIALPLAVAAGLGIGSATALDAPTLIGGAGVALSAFMALAGAVAVFQEVEPRLPLARRVAGAWVGAIGLLIGAIYLRG